MKTDKFGQHIYSEDEICDAYMRDSSCYLKNILTDQPISIDVDLEITHVPNIKVYQPENLSIEQFDKKCQSNWKMPSKYKNLDIAEFILSLCKTQHELQRVGKELILYQDRNLFNLLRYLVYLVDTMRKNNVICGVGRGSSVSSYVLYLISLHKINSMYYDLDIEEFLR